jgi:hypothetical protein
MRSRLFSSALLAVAILLASTGIFFAGANRATAGEVSAELIAPLVDRQTLVVGHIDLRAFDAMETVDWAAELFELPDASRDRMQADVAPIKLLTQALPDDATVDVYIFSSLLDFGRLPFFLALPLKGHTPAAAISSEVRRDLEKDFGRALQTETVGDLLITGSPETIERLKKAPPVDRPEIAAAFTAVGPGAVQLAFVPSAELRKLAETLFPQLPQSIGGGPTKTFTQGVTWVATSIELPPEEVAIRLIVQSTDAEAATALASEIEKLFQTVGQLPKVRETIPEFDDHAKKLLPITSGDQLKLDLTEANGGIAALTTIAGPLSQALRTATNAKQP